MPTQTDTDDPARTRMLMHLGDLVETMGRLDDSGRPEDRYLLAGKIAATITCLTMLEAGEIDSSDPPDGLSTDEVEALLWAGREHLARQRRDGGRASKP